MHQFIPGYLTLLKHGELQARIEIFKNKLLSCSICPRNCGVNRLADEKGFCQTGRLARVHSYSPHYGEEKVISGDRGSGTIFFSGCNLHCVYCQNSDISQENYGLEMHTEKLAEVMLNLQEMGCHNINLVTPTHVIPQIMEALIIASQNGLNVPLVYNSGGYDKSSTLKLLAGVIDIYMPDMKYSNADIAFTYSGINDYPAINQAAVKEMHHQVGDLSIDEKGYAQRGLLIRHLVLPGYLTSTKDILEFIYHHISKKTYVNIMAQYRPQYHASDFPKLSKPLRMEEYLSAIQTAHDIGLSRLDGFS